MKTTIIKNSDGISIPIIIQKAENSTDIDVNDNYGEYQEITPEIDIAYLKEIATESTITPQCISAYQVNIAGFGTQIAGENEIEQKKLQEIIDNFNYDMKFEKVFEKIIEYREQCGIAYLEIIRNGLGEVVELHALDPQFIIQTSRGPNLEFEQIINCKKISRRKRFRKFVQRVNAEIVYYKEFNFSKFMDYRNGNITEIDNGQYEANEILVFKLGSELYGSPRWWGQSINCQGSKMAEFVNYNYFINGRHTPMMIVVKGGTLSDKSWTDLQAYMNDIKGYKNSHGFLVLEVAEIEKGVSSLSLTDGKGEKIDVEIKDMSPMLQKDALFSQYLKDNEKGVQSAFKLPDIYVGKTTDYNRATAIAAIEVTEKQVFQPERLNLEWIINKLLLGEYAFKDAKVKFKSMLIQNTDDLFKILTATTKAGGATPALAQKLINKYTDEEIEEFKEDWANIPIEVLKLIKGTNANTEEVKKAKQRDVDILKDVRNALIDLTDKYDL